MIRSILKDAFINVFKKIENPDSVGLILDAGVDLGFSLKLRQFFSMEHH